MADYTSIHTGAKIDDAVTKVNGENLVANKALVTDASKKLVSTSVTDTEISYLSGASSNIQTQLGNKLNSSDYTANDVLAKIKTVDGVGSGLDADTFQGSTPLAFALSGHTHSNYEPTLTKGNLLGTTSQILVSGGTNAVIGSGASLSLAATPIVGGIEITSATINTVPIINPLKQVASSSVTSTELGHLSGVTSGIQSQLNSKEPTLTKGNLTGTNILVSNGTNSVIGTGTSLSLASTPILEGLEVSSLTANRALYSDNLKQVKSSNVTDTELGYLSGVTSSIQTQINNIGAVTKGNLTSTSLTVTNGTDAVLGAGTQINLPATPIVSNLTITDLTANRALVSNTDKQVISSSVTNTELGYLSGVTSGVQSQFNKTLEEVDTIANVKLKGIANNRNVYCRATNTIYTYLASGAAYTPNDFNILTTADGGNTRWIAIQDMLYTNLQTSTYSGTGFLSRTTTTMSIVGQNFTIAPTGSSFDIYINGTKYVKTSSSITLPLTVGMHYIYFDSSAILTTSMTPWEIPSSKVFVASAYCNGNEYTISDERHGANRNMDWHRWSHYTVGARFESGLVGTFSTSATSFTSGKIHDEDIANVIAAQSGNCILKWYRNPVNFYFTATPIAVTANIVAGALKYDNSGTLTSVSNNQYTTNWIYATNDITNPIYMVTGQAQYSSQANAEAATLPDFANFPNNEMKLIYAVVWRNASGTPTYISSKDYRFSIGLPGGGTTATNASSVAYIPYSTISSTNVQSAIQELTDEVNSLVGLTDCMVYKGTIDCSGNPNYPAADAGWTYKVSVAGKIGGVSGKVVEVGDLVICFVDSSVTGDEATVGTNWNVIQGNIDGAVTSSSVSSNDNSIARMDLTSGKVIQTSLATIDDNGSINIPTGQSYKINNSALAYTDVGAASSTHSHGNITSAGAIGSTSGLPIITTTSGVLTTGSFGTTAGTFCQGDDSRLSGIGYNAYSITFNNSGTGGSSGITYNGATPVTISYNTIGAASSSHSHGNITNAGAIGSTADLPVVTTTSGVLTTGTYGTLAGTTDQVNLSASGTNVLNGTSITLSLPQSIATTSTPQFSNLGLGIAATANYKINTSYAIDNTNNVYGIYILDTSKTTTTGNHDKYGFSYSSVGSYVASGQANNNNYWSGVEVKNYVSSTSHRGTLDNQMGINSTVGINTCGVSGTVTNSFGVKSTLNCLNANATITNGYLFYGFFNYSSGTATNRYGIYMTGETKNYLSGSLEVGTNITVTGLTADYAVVTNASKVLSSSTTTSQQLGYLSTTTSNVQTQIDGKAPTAHAVNASTYGYGDASNAGHVRIGTGITITTGTISVTYGTTSTSACRGNDARLSDTRLTTNSLTFDNSGTGGASGSTFNGSAALTVSYNTVGAAPLSHTHGNITNAGAIGSTSGLPVVTTTSGVLTTGTYGTLTGTTNQVNLSASGTNVLNGTSITLSLPQNIHLSATPQFDSLGLGTTANSNYKLVIDRSDTDLTAGYGIYATSTNTLTTNGTKSSIGASFNSVNIVPTGVTNSGYNMGLSAFSRINSASFAGTLTSQYGLSTSTGFVSCAAGSIITNNYGVHSSILLSDADGTITNGYIYYGEYAGSSTTVTNKYGLYLTGEILNYLSGILAIGGATADSKYGINITRAIDNTNDIEGIKIIDTSNTTSTGAYIKYGVSYTNTSSYVSSGQTNNSTTGWIGVNINNYISSASHQGTLATQLGVWAKVGNHTSGIGGTVTNSYGFKSTLYCKSNDSTITNSYLYYGDYDHTLGTITNKWGIYLTGESKNYISGSIGIGTTDIEAWTSTYRAIEFYGSAILGANTGTSLDLYSNAYYATTEKYKTTAAAANYTLSNGQHTFRVAASGTIDTDITWTTALTIANTGAITTSSTLVTGGKITTGAVGKDGIISQDSTAYAQGVGGGIYFQGKYNTGGSYSTGATISTYKENATDGNYAFGLEFNTRANGAGAVARALYLGSDLNAIFYKGISVNNASFETSQVGGISIKQGTDPSTNSIDQVTLYATSGASATLGLCTEATVVSESVTSDRTLSIKINGTVYKLCLKA